MTRRQEYWFSNDVLGQWRKRRGVRLAPPSILLVNRLISRDALDLLYRKTLVLDSPSSDRTATGRLFDITEFISQSVLQRVKWVALKLDFSINGGKAWTRYLEMLSDTWCQRKVLKSCVWNSLTRIHDGQTSIGLLPSFSLVQDIDMGVPLTVLGLEGELLDGAPGSKGTLLERTVEQLDTHSSHDNINTIPYTDEVFKMVVRARK